MLEAERYQRAKAIFFDACECVGEARASLIERACEGDAELREAVCRLLSHDDHPLTMINAGRMREHLEQLADSSSGDGTGAEAGAETGDAEASRSMPARIGRYRILSRLGAGGMGVVYLAEQENPRRQVALKVIASGQSSRQMLRRFEHEAQILGRLHHPGIAAVYEAGMHDSGEGAQPYFAMELVRGKPLLRHCEEAGADRRARLALFVAICEAVQHAHQQGVIHRDLKPANILVAASDGLKPVGPAAQPKILDFGVARLTDSDVHATTMHTAADQLIGTVAYMSPEQMSGDSAAIDTRCDVYALGVMLFELLAGRLPHDVAGKTIPEMIRSISEHEPTTLSSISRTFRGDLDTIVGKAMERDKTRRYQSAGELAADVQRFLDDEPIHARPPSTLYQMHKFARRNKALVGGVAAVFLALVGGIITTAWQARQAIVARDEQIDLRKDALAFAQRAQAEADKALSVSGFLQHMLSSARPAITQGRDLTVREVLDEAARELDVGGEDLAPEVEGALRVTVARAYLALGRHEVAQPHLDLAMTRLRAAYGSDHVTIADCLEAMGRAARDRGEWEDAEKLTRNALEMMRRLKPGDDLLTAQVLASLGWIAPRLGRMQEAEESFTEALAMMTRLRGEDDVETASLKIDLASISHNNPAQSEQMVTDAIEDITRKLGDRDLALPRALNLLGAYQQIDGRLAEAEASYQRALDIRLAVHGPDAAEVIDSVQLIAWVASNRGESRRALELMQTYLPHARIATRDDDLLLASYLGRLASCHLACGEKEAAAEYMRETIAAHDRDGQAPKPALATTLAALAVLQAEAGDDDEAMRLAERCLALPKDLLPDGHWVRGEALLATGQVKVHRGEFSDAETRLLESHAILKGSGVKFRPRRDRATQCIIDMYEQWNAREPSPERTEQLQQWRAAMPKE